MAVLKQPYTGVRGMRYQFMLDNLPEQVAELKASGETESYLECTSRMPLPPPPADALISTG